MRISEATEAYLLFRRGEGYKPSTIQADRVALRRVARILEDQQVGLITAEDIDLVYQEMTDRRLRANTFNLASATMRGFFTWAMDRGLHPGPMPTAGRRYRKREARPLTRIPLAQFPAFLDAAKSPRDRMLLALGLYTMARRKEMTGIRIKDLDLDSSEILIYVSKSNLYDRRPISTELRAEIARWLPIYAEEVGPLEPDYFLVPATWGGNRHKVGWKMRPRKEMTNPEDAVHHALRQIGIDDSYHSGCHVLRRSSARAIFDELSNRGYDGALRTVSAWLNHSSTAQTEVYLGMELDKANRDSMAKDKPMFPSLVGDNVIRGAFDGQGRAVGM